MARAKQTESASEPITFDEINRRKMRDRIESYREIVVRRAEGGTITVSDMERAAELLEHLGLPQYTFDRDVEAVRRHKALADKVQAAAAVAPANKQRADELAAEVEATRQRLEMLREEHRQATVKSNKPGAYSHSVKMLQHDHPHVLGDLDDAARLRIEEMDRRKRATVGGAA